MSQYLSSSPSLIDLNQRSLYISAIAIAFNPTFWNTVARREYHHKSLTRLFNGNSQRACYALALTIFSLGLFRDALYERALRSQPTHPFLQQPSIPYIAYALILTGNILVLSSTWALGITGTYLGDYFGILMDAPVTGFPFNVTGAPMYYGSTMSFLGTALLYARPAGVLLTGEVLLVYWVALGFEDPFTSEIYAKRDRKRRAGKKTE
ncbi:Phosphatidyl-N-methylethanolamine N-methyltransferase [Xanthoria parietina]